MIGQSGFDGYGMTGLSGKLGLCCARCGALVLPEMRQLHDEWHEALEEAFKNVSSAFKEIEKALRK